MTCTEWSLDADTHITEPGDVWTSRLPRKFQDAAPRMVRTDDGVYVWRFGRAERKIPVGATAVAGWPQPFPSIPRNLDECPPAAYASGGPVRGLSLSAYVDLTEIAYRSLPRTQPIVPMPRA